MSAVHYRTPLWARILRFWPRFQAASCPDIEIMAGRRPKAPKAAAQPWFGAAEGGPSIYFKVRPWNIKLWAACTLKSWPEPWNPRPEGGSHFFLGESAPKRFVITVMISHATVRLHKFVANLKLTASNIHVEMCDLHLGALYSKIH